MKYKTKKNNIKHKKTIKLNKHNNNKKKILNIKKIQKGGVGNIEEDTFPDIETALAELMAPTLNISRLGDNVVEEITNNIEDLWNNNPEGPGNTIPIYRWQLMVLFTLLKYSSSISSIHQVTTSNILIPFNEARNISIRKNIDINVMNPTSESDVITGLIITRNASTIYEFTTLYDTLINLYPNNLLDKPRIYIQTLALTYFNRLPLYNIEFNVDDIPSNTTPFENINFAIGTLTSILPQTYIEYDLLIQLIHSKWNEYSTIPKYEWIEYFMTENTSWRIKPPALNYRYNFAILREIDIRVEDGNIYFEDLDSAINFFTTNVEETSMITELMDKIRYAWNNELEDYDEEYGRNLTILELIDYIMSSLNLHDGQYVYELTFYLNYIYLLKLNQIDPSWRAQTAVEDAGMDTQERTRDSGYISFLPEGVDGLNPTECSEFLTRFNLLVPLSDELR